MKLWPGVAGRKLMVGNNMEHRADDGDKANPLRNIFNCMRVNFLESLEYE